MPLFCERFRLVTRIDPSGSLDLTPSGVRPAISAEFGAVNREEAQSRRPRGRRCACSRTACAGTARNPKGRGISSFIAPAAIGETRGA